MLITHYRQRIVGVELIGINFCSFFNVCVHNWHDCFGLSIVNRSSNQLATALDHSKYSRLGFCASALIVSSSLACMFILFFAAVVRLVHFNIAFKWIISFAQHLADKIAHTPSRLVSNARLTLNLFGGNTIFAL